MCRTLSAEPAMNCIRSALTRMSQEARRLNALTDCSLAKRYVFVVLGAPQIILFWSHAELKNRFTYYIYASSFRTRRTILRIHRAESFPKTISAGFWENVSDGLWKMNVCLYRAYSLPSGQLLRVLHIYCV